ncbi:uncharacterized protein LOC124372828 [Homalodisca vitripennis]|uniref:uncharacterized protein LOC124372828 n=1 Tax=Homalodisca vitripennis TaxID=197043 RepID=UPI001EEA3E5E|nr:uncharacterized protein LOC124372828 [Homalodisca vitripennis]
MSRSLNCLFVVILNWTVVNSNIDLDSPIRLAHCRATCLYKIQITITSDQVCRSSFNCTQCWETCEVLLRDRSPCNQPHCGVGCKEACRFPLLSRSSAELPQNEETLLLSDSRVSWPSTAGVYVVMGQQSGRPWTQLLQTLDSSAPIPPDLDLESVRVLEVQWQGLTKVYSPPPESPIVQLEAVLRSLGLDDKMIFASTETSETPLPQNVTSSWNLRVESMTQQFPLAMTRICWLAREAATNSLMYLVTWQLWEGILRGNLLTNSSCATLSLRPDTIYRVQVALLIPGSHEGESEPLVVDTHLVHTEDSSVLSSHVTTLGLGQHVTLTHHGQHVQSDTVARPRDPTRSGGGSSSHRVPSFDPQPYLEVASPALAASHETDRRRLSDS